MIALRTKVVAAAVGVAATIAIAGTLLTGGPAARAVNGTTTLTGGTLTFTVPSTVGFSGSLTGADQTLSATQAIDVLDSRGSTGGWNITLTTTTWTSGTDTLATTATTDSATPTGACDSGADCLLADVSGLSYPIAVPAGTTAPTAVKIQAAKTSSGMGSQTWTHTMNLAIPAKAKAGTYSSTWTYSLVSGP